MHGLPRSYIDFVSNKPIPTPISSNAKWLVLVVAKSIHTSPLHKENSSITSGDVGLQQVGFVPDLCLLLFLNKI